MKAAEGQPLLPGRDTRHNDGRVRRLARLLVFPLGLLLVLCFVWPLSSLADNGPDISEATLTTCAWSTLRHHVGLLDVPPISRAEFLHRQAELGKALARADLDAFVAEPSAATAYLANVSAEYERSERAFLILVDRTGVVSTVSPRFERGRIEQLELVHDGERKMIEYDEGESPGAVLTRQRGDLARVTLEAAARVMIHSDLVRAGIDVRDETFPQRAVKSPAELAILRAINTFTVELVRALASCLEEGTLPSTVARAGATLFHRAGLPPTRDWSIVLAGPAAASPHGGSGVTERGIRRGEFVLVDIGSSLHAYGSDVTRTFLPPRFNDRDDDDRDLQCLTTLWWIVHDAQTLAMNATRAGHSAGQADAAARDAIAAAGYGTYFTHRLGHGLGLEMHEPPYLVHQSRERLQAGQVVTNEPGIYVTEREARQFEAGSCARKLGGFGIRIEDAIVVMDGEAQLLTNRRAQSPFDP